MGTIFNGASPFDTPRPVSELVRWARKTLKAGDRLRRLVHSGQFTSRGHVRGTWYEKGPVP